MPLTHRRALYSIPEAAELLSISKSGLRALIRIGKVRSVHVGGRRLVAAKTIDQIVAKGL